MTSGDDPNIPPELGFADDDDNVNRYMPVFDDDDDAPDAVIESPAPPEPVFDDDDDQKSQSVPLIPEQDSPTPAFADDDDESAEPVENSAEPEPTGPQPTPTPIVELPPVGDDVLADKSTASAAPTPAEANTPAEDQPSSVDDVQEGAEVEQDDALSSTTEVGDDFLGLSDDFFNLSSPPRLSVPHGLPSLQGVSATEIASVEEWIGDDTVDMTPQTTGTLWAADDITVAGATPVESPDFTIGTVADQGTSEQLYSGDEHAAQPQYAEPAAPAPPVNDPDPYDEPAEPTPASYMSYPEGEYAEDDSAGYGDGEYDDYDSGEYDGYDEGQDEPQGLDPDALVPVGSKADLRERARNKKKGRKSKDKADAKLAKERGEKGSLITGKTLSVAAVVVIGGFFAVRAFSGGAADTGAPAAQDSPNQSASATETPPSSPAPGEDCMTATEQLGVAVECSAAGDQRTGTNAILAYENAFYKDRDADKVYSLTWKSSQGGPDAEESKSGLQKGINGTPCGSTYTVRVTPKEIGRLYDVTISITSPPGDRLPSADGVCPTDIPVSDAPGHKVRTLVQEVAVDGAPGSYVIRSIKTAK